jgi:hypothetical protein
LEKPVRDREQNSNSKGYPNSAQALVSQLGTSDVSLFRNVPDSLQDSFRQFRASSRDAPSSQKNRDQVVSSVGYSSLETKLYREPGEGRAGVGRLSARSAIGGGNSNHQPLTHP